jgi:hypothetical protein
MRQEPSYALNETRNVIHSSELSFLVDHTMDFPC